MAETLFDNWRNLCKKKANLSLLLFNLSVITIRKQMQQFSKYVTAVFNITRIFSTKVKEMVFKWSLVVVKM